MSADRPKATLAQAQAAWNAHPNPSIRNVAKALQDAGLTCSIASVQRWHAAGWTDRRRGPRSPEVMEERARKQRRAKASTVAHDAVDAVMNLVQGDMVRVEALDRQDDAELVRQATRKELIARIIFSEELAKRAAFLVETSPAKVATIIEALKGAAANTTIVVPPADSPGDDAKVVNGRSVEKSATQLAIERFQDRRRLEIVRS